MAAKAAQVVTLVEVLVARVVLQAQLATQANLWVVRAATVGLEALAALEAWLTEATVGLEAPVETLISEAAEATVAQQMEEVASTMLTEATQGQQMEAVVEILMAVVAAQLTAVLAAPAVEAEMLMEVLAVKEGQRLLQLLAQ
jgi:hypothetical protein